jgi:hypothetical protein
VINGCDIGLGSFFVVSVLVVSVWTLVLLLSFPVLLLLQATNKTETTIKMITGYLK